MSRSSLLAILAAAVAFAACDPFGLPATRSLESGAADMLTNASSYELKGTYSTGAIRWTIDMQLVAPKTRHITVTSQDETVEALIIGPEAYFRGQGFLAKHAPSDTGPLLAQAAGNAWWRGAASLLPSLPDFTDGSTFRTTFLGSAVTQRTDHQTVDGMDAVELSGARADVYIASAAPYVLLRVRLKPGVQVDGLTDADLHYGSVGKDFHLTTPAAVIDFGNLSTLPPIYTVVSVDVSGCGSPCVVAATLRNLGGTTGAKAPSSVTFTMKSTSGQVLGTCQATVRPDVGYNATTTVSCTIPAQATNAAVVTAETTNPGHA